MIFGRNTPVMEFLFIPNDVGSSCKLSFGPKNALHFQSKVHQGNLLPGKFINTLTENSLFLLLNFGG